MLKFNSNVLRSLLLILSFHFTVDAAPNEELTLLVKQDQQERINGEFTYYTDQERRKRVEQIMADAQLIEPIDYFNAALIFQHGTSSDHYLKAFQLASKAAAMKLNKAKWLACAAEDRYLLSLGKKQIWGTQFTNTDGYELSPMDETAKSDLERQHQCNLATLEQIKAKVLNRRLDSQFKN